MDQVKSLSSAEIFENALWEFVGERSSIPAIRLRQDEEDEEEEDDEEPKEKEEETNDGYSE